MPHLMGDLASHFALFECQTALQLISGANCRPLTAWVTLRTARARPANETLTALPCPFSAPEANLSLLPRGLLLTQ